MTPADASAHHLDILAEPAGWTDVLPGGEGPMSTLIAAVAGNVDELADRGLARIRAEVPDYAGVPSSEHGNLWWATKRNIQTELVCRAEQRPLRGDELEVCHLLGARAAERGIPLESVMHAFRLGFIVVWNALREAADDLGPAAARALLDSAGHMWLSLEDFASALANGHRDASAVQSEDTRRRTGSVRRCAAPAARVRQGVRDRGQSTRHRSRQFDSLGGLPGFRLDLERRCLLRGREPCRCSKLGRRTGPRVARRGAPGHHADSERV